MKKTFVPLIAAAAFECANFSSGAPSASGQPFQGKIALSSRDSIPDWPPATRANDKAPNIVVILLDDVGYGATDLFGGPVKTPELDRLAAGGLIYNRFHTTALCSPTRASLLSGRNDHRVGFGTTMENLSGYPGYNGLWKKSAASIARVLQLNGYSTAAFGKWHNTPYWEISPMGPFDRWPTGLGFDYFFGFMGADDSQWNTMVYRNTSPTEMPKKGDKAPYFTTAITDEAIGWINTHDAIVPEKPFFIYFAPGATHKPHHASEEWIRPYEGKFDDGWDKLRASIFERQKATGIIPKNTDLPPRPECISAWDAVPADRKRLLCRQMEVYAGYLAQTDFEVGRLLHELQGRPAAANTLIFYIVGDNGASGESEWGYPALSPEGLQDPMLLGGPLYENHYSAGWAAALSTPFKWQKLIASNLGGTRDPLIVSWPDGISDRGGLRSQYTDVNDVAPTIYDAAGITPPSTVDGVEQMGMDGTSFTYSFNNPDSPSRHRVQVFEQFGNRAIYRDGWVADSQRMPAPWKASGSDDYQSLPWQLYNLEADFSEAHDLAKENPGKLDELKQFFDEEARRTDIYPMGGTSDRKAPPPSPISGRRSFVYHADLPRLPVKMAPDFRKAHRIAAEVIMGAKQDEGVLVSYGGIWSGFVLYVKEGRLVYEFGIPGKRRNRIVSSIECPEGASTLAFEFSPVASADGRWPALASGTGRLFINEQCVGQGDVSFKTTANGAFSIGRAFGTVSSDEIQPPYSFGGTIGRVTVELK